MPSNGSTLATFSTTRYAAVWRLTYIPLTSAGLVALSFGVTMGSVPVRKSARVSGALALATSMLISGFAIGKAARVALTARATIGAAPAKKIVSHFVEGIADTVTMTAARVMRIARATPLTVSATLAAAPAKLTRGTLPLTSSISLAVAIASTRKWLPLFANFNIGTAAPSKAQALSGVASSVSAVIGINRSVIAPKTWSDGTAATFSDTTAIQYSN